MLCDVNTRRAKVCIQSWRLDGHLSLVHILQSIIHCDSVYSVAVSFGVYTHMYLLPSPLSWQDLIHGAPIGKPVASRAKVTAVYGEDDEEEIHFTRM